MRRLCLAALLVVLGFSTAASAAVCLSDVDNDAIYQFAKLKLPNKFGATASVSGIALIGGIPVAFPVVGAVTRQGEDVWVIGFTRYGQTCAVTGTLDANLAGSFNYDCNFNGTIDETVPVEVVDCAVL
jgi:hypothetical protein